MKRGQCLVVSTLLFQPAGENSDKFKRIHYCISRCFPSMVYGLSVRIADLDRETISEDFGNRIRFRQILYEGKVKCRS